MPMLARLLLTFLFLATVASAETLALPDKLVALSSQQGEHYLLESEEIDSYVPISVHFETQKTQAFCGVASMVMTLNTLQVPAPTSPEYQPYAMFTQDNLLDDGTDAVLPRATIARMGLTLDQLGGMLALHPVAVEVHHAEPGGLDAFRKAAGERWPPGAWSWSTTCARPWGRSAGGTSRRSPPTTRGPTGS